MAQTDFTRREERDAYRRILIDIEHAANVVSGRNLQTRKQNVAVANLIRSQIAVQRLMLHEMDKMDPYSMETSDLDFETDLSIMLASIEDDPQPEPPLGNHHG